ncbi:MAG: hypothetical protein Q7W44_10505 [Coriobacteriia bacterium]|nr:hypothetical protein [Coriobacteriia bacterium]
MAGVLVFVAVLAGCCAYVVGHAFVAPGGSFLRSATGGIILAGCVLVALFAPPLLAGAIASGGLDPALYRALWLVLVAFGLLLGMRAWRMRLRRGGLRGFTLDESPVSRAEAGLPLADSLEDALDVLGREKVTARDMPQLAGGLRRVGSRFFHQLPERSSEVYALVARHVPTAVAADVTGLLLEGAGRKR